MAYDEELAHRIRELLAEEDGVSEMAMFGGLAFMLHGNMAVGVTSRAELMVRVGPQASDAAAARPHARPFDMTARPMKGWVLVDHEGLRGRHELAEWVDAGVAFARGLPAKGAARRR